MAEILDRVRQGTAKLFGSSAKHEAFGVKSTKPIDIETNPQEPLVITMTGLQAVETTASEMAERMMQKKPGEKGLGSIVRTVWKRSLFSEYFRERYTQYSEELIKKVNNNVFAKDRFEKAEQEATRDYEQTLKNNNVMKRAGTKLANFLRSAVGKKTTIQQLTLNKLTTMVDDIQNQHLQEQVGATADRVQDEFNHADKLLGEKEEVFALTGATQIEQDIIEDGRRLMREYASGTLTDDEFNTQSKHFWELIKKLRPNLRDKADLYTTSLFEVAKALRVQAEHDKGMNVVNDRIATAQFRIGFAVMGGITATEMSSARKIVGRVERTTTRFEKTPLGALLFNEVTVGNAVSLGISLSFIPRSLAGNLAKVVAPFGGSVVAGALGTAREYRRLWRELKVYLREKEIGIFQPGTPQGKHREWYEQFSTPLRSAQELTSAIHLGAKPTTDEIRGVFGNLADAQARINTGSRKDIRIGLIGYSKNAVESERADLYRAIHQARHQLETLDQATLDQVTGGGKTVKEYLATLVNVQSDNLAAAIFSKQKEFRPKAARKAMRYGATVATVGIVSSEVLADAVHFFQTGHVEAVGAISQAVRGLQGTPLEELANRVRGIGLWHGIGTTETPLPNGLKALIPDHTHLTVDPKGGYDLVFDAKDPVHANLTVIRGIKFDDVGHITNQADLKPQLDKLGEYDLRLSLGEQQLPGEGQIAGTFDKSVGDMGKTQGFRGPWGWLEEHFSASNHGGKTNLAKNLFRSFEENVDQYQHISGVPANQLAWHEQGKLLNYNLMPKKLTFEKLPDAVFSDHALRLQDAIGDDAVKFHAGTLTDLANNPLHLDADHYKRLLELAYKAGPGDHLLSTSEFNEYARLLGGGKGPQFESMFNLEKLTQIPAPPIPVGFHPPMEEILAKAAPITPLEHAYPYAYEAYGLGGKGKDAEYYKKRFSPTIRENPLAKLNPEHEIDQYLSSLNENERRELENFNNELPRADNECRVFCCVPVYDLGEGKVILRSLNQYLFQVNKSNNKYAVDPKQFEVILFLNHPTPARQTVEQKLGTSYITDASAIRAKNYLDNPEVNPIEPHDTEAVINEFKKRHPELRIRVIKKEFDTRPAWGKIIKPIYDLASLRAHNRTTPINPDPLIVTNDADAVRYAPWYIDEIIKYADSHPNTDAFVGRYDWAQEAYAKNATFHVASRFETFISSILRHRRKAAAAQGGPYHYQGPIHTPGPNTILRGSIYSAIGGVNEETDVGADGELGKIVFIARDKHLTVDYHHKIYTDMDPRRAIQTFNSGIPLVGTWSSWGDLSLYGPDWQQRLKILGASDIVNQNRVEAEINAFVNAYGLNINSSEIQRVLTWIGFVPGDYQIQNGMLKINNISHVQQKTDEYRQSKAYLAHEKIAETSSPPAPAAPSPAPIPAASAAPQTTEASAPIKHAPPGEILRSYLQTHAGDMDKEFRIRLHDAFEHLRPGKSIEDQRDTLIKAQKIAQEMKSAGFAGKNKREAEKQRRYARELNAAIDENLPKLKVTQPPPAPQPIPPQPTKVEAPAQPTPPVEPAPQPTVTPASAPTATPEVVAHTIPAPETEEAQKKSKYKAVLDEEFISMLEKIHTELRRRNQLPTLDLEKVTQDIRGGMCEELSKITSFESGRTVFPSQVVAKPILMTFQAKFGKQPKKPDQYPNRVTKADILGDALRGILANTEYTPSQQEQIIKRFTGERTIIPDEGIFDERGIMVGFTEVKGYLPQEVGDMDNLATDLSNRLEKEKDFVNAFRLASGQKKLDDMPILLRVPSDIPDESLIALGESLKSKGFLQVIIQQLPASTDELREWAKESVQKHLEEIKTTRNEKDTYEFTDKFIKYLSEYSVQPTHPEVPTPQPVPTTETPTPEIVASIKPAPSAPESAATKKRMSKPEISLRQLAGEPELEEEYKNQLESIADRFEHTEKPNETVALLQETKRLAVKIKRQAKNDVDQLNQANRLNRVVEAYLNRYTRLPVASEVIEQLTSPNFSSQYKMRLYYIAGQLVEGTSTEDTQKILQQINTVSQQMAQDFAHDPTQAGYAQKISDTIQSLLPSL